MFIYYSTYNKNTNADDTAFKTWLTNNNVVLYYALATPTDTQITDDDLIADLNALAGARSTATSISAVRLTSQPRI